MPFTPAIAAPFRSRCKVVPDKPLRLERAGPALEEDAFERALPRIAGLVA